jgi:hypothetical protein
MESRNRRSSVCGALSRLSPTDVGHSPVRMQGDGPGVGAVIANYAFYRVTTALMSKSLKSRDRGVVAIPWLS